MHSFDQPAHRADTLQPPLEILSPSERYIYQANQRSGLVGKLTGDDLIVVTGGDVPILTVHGEYAGRLFELQETSFRKPIPKGVPIESINRPPVCWDVVGAALGLVETPRIATGSWLKHPFGEALPIDAAFERFKTPFVFQIRGKIIDEAFYPAHGTEDEYTEKVEFEGTIHVGLIVGRSTEEGTPIAFEKNGTIDGFGFFKYWSESLRYYTSRGTVDAYFASVDDVLALYHRVLST